MEGLFEEFREKEKGGAGIESVVVGMDEGTASSCKGVLFKDSDRESAFRQAGSCCKTSYSSAWKLSVVCKALETRNAGFLNLPMIITVCCLSLEAILRDTEG